MGKLTERNCGGCNGTWYDGCTEPNADCALCPYCNPGRSHGMTYADRHRGFGITGDLPGSNAGRKKTE